MGQEQQPTLHPTQCDTVHQPTTTATAWLTKEGRTNSYKYSHVYHVSAKVSTASYRISQWYPIGGLDTIKVATALLTIVMF